MELILQIIALLISIYTAFFQRNDTNKNLYTNSTFKQQNNFYITMDSNFHNSNSSDNVEYDNRRHKCKRIIQLFAIFFTSIFIFYFVKWYIEGNIILSNLVGILSSLYIPIFSATRFILMIILILNIFFIISEWNKEYSIWENFNSSKYFFIKLVFTILCLLSMISANELLIGKILNNKPNTIYSWIPFLIIFIPISELYWIQLTMQKRFRLIKNETNKQKEIYYANLIITFAYPLLPTLALLYAMFF